MCGFYKLNNELLKFDYDSLECKFAWFIMRRENLERTKSKLPKGQFELSYAVIETELEVSRGVAQRIVRKFIDMGIIEPILITKVRGEKSIYGYVLSYENSEIVGQATDTQNDKQNDKQNDSNSNSFNSATDTQNDKQNDKSKKEYIKRISKKNKNIFVDTSNEVQLSQYLFKLILKNNEKAKEPNIQVWAKEIDKMLRIDKRTVEEIKMVIEFSQNDNFWCSNILSTKKLREKFDMLYMRAKQKTPTAIGANKKTNYNQSICNNQNKYTQKAKEHKFV